MSKDTDVPYKQRLKESIREEREESPLKEIPRWQEWGWTGILGINLLLTLFFLINGNIIVAFLIVTTPIIVFLIFTKTGQAFVEFLQEEMNQDQGSPDNSNQKIVCQNCGWQNPVENSYCHDCGSTLKSERYS